MPDEDPVQAILITGAPGAGRSEVARRLVTRLPGRAALIDLDTLAAVQPWTVDDAFLDLVTMNFTNVLGGYLRWGARLVVVAGVMVPGALYDRMTEILHTHDVPWRAFALRASPDVLSRRIRTDAKFQHSESRIADTGLDLMVGTIPGIRQVWTDQLTLDTVVDLLYQESVIGPVSDNATGGPDPQAAMQTPMIVAVDAGDARRAVARYLARCGVPARTAHRVARQLVDAEQESCPSHGLLRVLEYAEAVREGTLLPAAVPCTTIVRPGVSVINGRNGFGVLALDAVASSLRHSLASELVAVAAVRAAGHMGMLAPLGRELAKAGICTLGFVNYSGGGQKVVPPGAAQPRLATNPLLFACPGGSGNAVVVDMTTAATSEGAVRVLREAGHPVPAGLLLDADGRIVTEPDRLYGDPPTGFIAPLGWPTAAHRGYALAVAVEILAGAIAGGGVAGSVLASPGNSGLFFAFRPDIAGVCASRFTAYMDALHQHLTSTTVHAGSPAIRLPGQRQTPTTALHVPAELWNQLSDDPPLARHGTSRP